MMAPILPATLWLLAAAFLILLILVVFGYHLYQRSRLKAFASEAASLGQLAARKERLEADATELRKWLSAQKQELQKLEGERHRQELLRADIAQQEAEMAKRGKANDQSLKYAADLDILIVKKRNLLSRLEAEVRDMESRKAELEPVQASVQTLRAEIEQGKIRAALLAEQELRTANLQQVSYALGREIDELQRTLDPLRHEKNRLHLFIEQARHASSVKNERILEQNEQIRTLELTRNELQRDTAALSDQLEGLRQKAEAARAELETLETARAAAEAETGDRIDALKQTEEELAKKLAQEQQQVDYLSLRREEQTAEINRLSSRLALLELETGSCRKNGPAKRRRKQEKSLPHTRTRGKARKTARSSQIFSV